MVSDKFVFDSEKAMPCGIETFGAPFLLGQRKDWACFTASDLPWLGVGYFLRVCTANLVWMVWPKGGETVTLNAAMWADKAEATSLVRQNTKTCGLGEGDLVWVPPGYGSMLLSVTPARGDGFTFAVYQPFFSQGMLAAMEENKCEHVIRFQRNLVKNNRNDVLVSTFGTELMKWPDAT